MKSQKSDSIKEDISKIKSKKEMSELQKQINDKKDTNLEKKSTKKSSKKNTKH